MTGVGVDKGTMPPGMTGKSRPPQFTQEQISLAFASDPNITGKRLAEVLGCGYKTACRHAELYGFRFKPWSERKHSPETRARLSLLRAGGQRGSDNPNYGVKDRPWLTGTNNPLHRWHQDHPEFGSHQQGDANPVHKVMYLYEDPSYVDHITRGLAAHAARKRGSTYDEVYGPERAEEIREKLRQASPGRMTKFARKETGPERVVREILTGMGVMFQAQAPVGHYTVDFLVPSARLVIQADGDYWHAHPAVYGDSEGLRPLSRIQRNRKRLDASCDSYLVKAGYRVVRLWERDLNGNRSECEGLLRASIGVL